MIWTAGGRKRAEEGLREGARKQGEKLQGRYPEIAILRRALASIYSIIFTLSLRSAWRFFRWNAVSWVLAGFGRRWLSLLLI